MKSFQIKTNDELWATKDVKELDELDALVTLISDYEDKTFIEERKNQAEIEVKIIDL
jgi:hypothetical protein